MDKIGIITDTKLYCAAKKIVQNQRESHDMRIRKYVVKCAVNCWEPYKVPLYQATFNIFTDMYVMKRLEYRWQKLE